MTFNNWWASTENLRWATQNAHKSVFRSREVAVGDAQVQPLSRNMVDLDRLNKIAVPWGKEQLTVGEWLQRSKTDALVALHCGRIVTEQYFGEMTSRDPHWAFSMTKTVLALACAPLLYDGSLDQNVELTRYVPEFAHTAFRGATVRQLLDMQTGIRYRYPEDVKNEPCSQAEKEWTAGTLEFNHAQHENARFCRASGGIPPLPNEESDGIYDFLLSFHDCDRPHGPPVHYAEPNPSAYQLVVERVTGITVDKMFGERIVHQLGFEQPVHLFHDCLGTVAANIGLFITARDFARVGQMVLDEGRANGIQVVPADFIADIRRNARKNILDERTNMWGLFPAATGYRSYTYAQPADAGQQAILFAAGAFGQWLIVDPAQGNVIVKFSSERSFDTSIHDYVALRSFSEALPELAP